MKNQNYELELVPRNESEESTFILLNEIGYSLSLVEFVESEFEDSMSDFKQIITRSGEGYSEIIDEYYTIDYYKDLLDDLNQPYHQVNEYVLLIFPTSSPMFETLPQTSVIVDDDVIILKLDLFKYDQSKYSGKDNVNDITKYVETR